ncbi:hypothetical protein O8B93_22145 [Agrobacterium rhizogenes]|uniref:hypothetical protein n=1 Tax=Rhizobium rhizogenes TaxID=359 RepID=UPI0022B6A24E|nr:hypothetical protein [Rhizobium rhizogenes]MCZ7450289.1 hypothetical protein [Rhizobium rhizogenes]
MSYKVTYEPLNRIRGVSPSTDAFETAGEALANVVGLEHSDEKITDITTPQGHHISRAELERLALKEQQRKG